MKTYNHYEHCLLNLAIASGAILIAFFIVSQSLSTRSTVDI